MPNQTFSSDAAQLAQLKSVPTATITNILYAKGLRNVFIRGTVPLNWPQDRLVGPAFTLRFVPAREGELASSGGFTPLSTRVAVENMPSGCVAVVDSMGVRDAGTFGDILCARMLKKGVAGLVSDGAVRDHDAINQCGFPVWSAAAAAPPPYGDVALAGLQEVIACGGTCVAPDDWIVADRDGAVVIPKSLIAEVLAEFPEHERRDEWIMSEVNLGAKLPGLYPMDASTLARYQKWQSEN